MSTTAFKKKFTVKLTTEQIAERGREMAVLSDKRKALKEERREAMASFKQRLAGIDERDEALALAVNEGKEEIEITVVRQADLARNAWVYVATSDSRVMGEEPMTLVEIADEKKRQSQQGDLPLRSDEDGRSALGVIDGGKSNVVPFAPPAAVDAEGFVSAGGGEPLPEGATFEEEPSAPAAPEELPVGLPSWATATRNDAGVWPLCPNCGGDTLRSAAVPPNPHRIVDCATCGWKPPLEQDPAATSTTSTTSSAPEGAGDAAGDAAPSPAPKAKRAIECPALVAKHDTDPRLDDICGGEGAGRRKGFCAKHYTELGGAKGSPEMTEALKRRKERERLEADAAKAERKEAAKPTTVPDAAAQASFTE